MADDADRAQQQSDAHLAHSLANSRKAEPGLQYTGACHNCEAFVAAPKRFCDSACADEYEAEMERYRRQRRGV
jgi:hypothetical protein